MNSKGFDINLAIRQIHLLPIGPYEPAWFEQRMKYIRSTRSGDPTLLYRKIHFHSKYDPVGESRRLIDSISIKNKETLVLFFGAGLGYTVRSFLDQLENPCVWFEPSVEILALALGTNDFSHELQSGRLRILTEIPDEVALTTLFKGRSNQDIEFVTHRASYLTSTEYADIQVRCETHLNRKAVNQATLSRFDKLWSRNFIKNLSFLLKARPVQELFDLTPGAIAVIAGAGPSLEHSIPDIRDIKEHIILIAVDTAAMVLYNQGVDPDVIVTVDPQHLNHHYLDGYRGDALFLIDSSTTPLTTRRIDPGKSFIFQSPFRLARYFFSQLGAEVGEIAYGGSVSTNAYDLGVRLGCDQIFLIGMDSGFPGGMAHVRGAVLEDRLKFQASRTFRFEHHNYKQMYALPVRYLPSGRKSSVATNDKLIIFYKWFQKRFQTDRENGKRIVNISRGGAIWEEIENTSRLPVQEILKHNSSEAQLLHSLKVRGSGTLLIPADRTTVLQFLNQLVIRMGELGSILRIAVSYSIELESIARQMPEQPESATMNPVQKRYVAITRKIESIDTQFKTYMKESEIAGTATQGIIFHITENFGTYLTEEEKANPFLENARKGTILYEALLESTEDLSRLLRKTVQQIEDS